MLTAINYIHNKGVAHRDIKLDNIMINISTMNVKLIDFGFSTLTEYGSTSRTFCGTPSYMAPELAAKREYIPSRVDMWAAGVVLFAMLHGYLPFKGNTNMQLYSTIRAGRFLVGSHVS